MNIFIQSILIHLLINRHYHKSIFLKAIYYLMKHHLTDYSYSRIYSYNMSIEHSIINNWYQFTLIHNHNFRYKVKKKKDPPTSINRDIKPHQNCDGNANKIGAFQSIKQTNLIAMWIPDTNYSVLLKILTKSIYLWLSCDIARQTDHLVSETMKTTGNRRFGGKDVLLVVMNNIAVDLKLM